MKLPHQSYLFLLLLVLSIFSSNHATAKQRLIDDADGVPEKMTQQKMETIVKGLATQAEGEKGRVVLSFQNVLIYLISDPINNRMRLVAPIAKYSELDKAHVDAAMIANFHLALDARYAVTQDVLYSAFLHPLNELTERQIESALRQVANLALTFGTSYSSGELSFGGKPKEKPIH